MRSDSGLPFADLQSLPAGTLLTVRLRNPVNADSASLSGVFDAILDEIVAVDGNALVAPGASAEGRIELAHASELANNRSYVRLTLESIEIDGRDFAVQTSSLFVHGDASVAPASGGTHSAEIVHLASGRRLTFRLTEPISLGSSPDSPVR